MSGARRPLDRSQPDLMRLAQSARRFRANPYFFFGGSSKKPMYPLPPQELHSPSPPHSLHLVSKKPSTRPVPSHLRHLPLFFLHDSHRPTAFPLTCRPLAHQTSLWVSRYTRGVQSMRDARNAAHRSSTSAEGRTAGSARSMRVKEGEEAAPAFPSPTTTPLVGRHLDQRGADDLTAGGVSMGESSSIECDQ